MKLLHEELTYQICASIYEVRKEIGVGFDEETYHQGLVLSFHRRSMPFISKEKRSLFHRGTHIRDFINDFVLFEKIIFSLKCIPCNFLQAHYVQLFSELKLWQKDLGLIANFGLPELDIERYAFTEKEPVFVENYEFIKNRITKPEQHILDEIEKAVKYVANLHKPGYGKVVWRKIVEAELKYLQISFSKNNILPVNFAGKTIRTYRLRHLIVEDKILLAITALQKGIDQIDVANVQSYLKALNLGVGLIVNFGKSKVQISGIRPS
jgi:GxxExxY protein